ncbi:MAG: PSD1 and planctomycete cytochrome C domain-containing protein [Verrucomicrobiales bacterium]
MLLLTNSRSCPPTGWARKAFLVTICVSFGWLDGVIAEEPPVDFAREILPLLSNKCFVCHGPDVKKESDLRLDSAAAATSDRGGYKAIDPSDPGESEILVRIHDKEDPMPPVDAEKQLTESERKLIDRWVREGGTYAKHWAFVPPSAGDGVERREIDSFVGAQLEAEGIGFSPEADRPTLARRAALVLTGLPPEPDQLAKFLEDKSPGAYGRLVDELLESPRYGEHQARYWLDAVRYGDTHGLHLDNRRGIYPYRDWVIMALNDNLPLDRFITWQLAGDLLPNPSLEQRVATGFVRMNPSTSEGGAIAGEFQAKNNFDRVETFGTVFLGLSLTCSRCHNHKYDPILQQEYYQLMAFFNSTAEKPLDGNKYDYGPAIMAPADVAMWKAWRAAEGNVAKQEEIKKGFVSTLVASDLPKPRTTFVLERGEYDQPRGEQVEPGTLNVVSQFPEGAPPNRLGLANWLTAAENPLTARVLINRVWQRVFGDGLVRTPEDFGYQGEQPTHPELLDWLAVELHDSGWDLKHMIRLMVTSRAFRQDSRFRDDVSDPENRLIARGPSPRLDAEVIRDVGLWASGLLDPTMGGEGIKPYQPDGLWAALMHPASNTKKYVVDTDEKAYRRSLYVYWKRTSPHPMMTLFDAPNRESSCVRRSRSNTALQSLGLLNESQRTEMARELAARVLAAAADDGERVDLLFRRLACRAAAAAERGACLRLLKVVRDRYLASPDDAAKLLGPGPRQAEAPLDPVEHAAWTQVAATVLASDIAILLY